MRKVKDLFRKIGHIYKDGFIQMYNPIIKCGINPFI